MEKEEEGEEGKTSMKEKMKLKYVQECFNICTGVKTLKMEI